MSVLLMTMGTCKAFEHYVNEALRKKAGSKVIDRSKGAEVVAYIPRWRKCSTTALYTHSLNA